MKPKKSSFSDWLSETWVNNFPQWSWQPNVEQVLMIIGIIFDIWLYCVVSATEKTMFHIKLYYTFSQNQAHVEVMLRPEP